MRPVISLSTWSLAVASLTYLGGCFCSGFTESGPPPRSSSCTDAPGTADITGLTVSARRELGTQGAEMIILDITWEGDVPDCVEAEVSYDGLGVTEQRVRVDRDGDRGHATLWTFYSWPSCGRAFVRSYGLVATDAYESPDPTCDPFTDAGPPRDGGPGDGGATDGSVSDGSVADAAAAAPDGATPDPSDAAAADGG